MASLSDHDLKVKVQQRTNTRSSVTREIKKIDPIFSETPPDLEKAEITVCQLTSYQDKLKALDEVIFPSVSDEKLAEEIQRADQYQDDIISAINRIQIRLRNLSLAATASSPTGPPGRLKEIAPKLPKLQITKYNGDPLLWDEFWDDFQSSVHDRADLPIIDKFKYLKSFLEGEALRLADGYRLTVANYDAVLSALKERFGDPQVATHSHFEALIALPEASHDLSELRSTLDKCESHIRSLVALGLPETTFGVVFAPLILSKLPRYVKMELHRKNGSNPWTLSNLRIFLKEEINAREKSERSFANQPEKAQVAPTSGAKPKPGISKPTKTNLATTSALASPAKVALKADPPGCAFCGGKHFSGQCRTYADLSSRLKRIRGYCHSCLRKNHTTAQCRSKRPCFHCRKEGHHQSLCAEKFGSRGNESGASMVASTTNTQHVESENSSGKPECNLSLQTPNSKSILQTAVAEVKGTKSKSRVRFYFDTGGSRSFISTSVAKKIGAKYIGEESVSVGRFRDSKRTSVSYKIYEFDVCLPNGDTKTVRMSAEATISCPIQLIPLDVQKYALLSQVKLAEAVVENPTLVSIDVLIGTDYYYDFIGQDQVRCSNGLVLLPSPFGFVVGGCLKDGQAGQRFEASLFISERSIARVPPLERFWSLEDIGIKDDYTQNDDEVALQAFNETIRFENNRYVVKWPWKDHFPELPDNYGLAFRRLKSLFTRIRSNEELLNVYNKTIVDQRKAGIIEEAPDKPDGAVHYIPHHCVVSPSKSTTKVRIVYDASAKAGIESLSLNECLHRGPVFLADSVGIILRWRLHKIAIVSDIEKAFLQIGLQKSDRDVTRFLWLKDVTEPPSSANLQVLRFCRVPFGVISSPFLLAATIAFHLKNTGGPIASAINDNVYVDNVFGGSDSVGDAVEYYRQAKVIFDRSSMNLREWFSNSSELIDQIQDIDRGKGESATVLGLKWNLRTDTFVISSAKRSVPMVRCTKRQILQSVASVFDPCGMFTPVTIAGKLLMQQLWKEKYDWDAALPDSIRDSWRLNERDLANISGHKLPRQLTLSAFQETPRLELHCFCDASTKAYAAVLYLRVIQDFVKAADLIFSRCRVAPIKPLSVPRLELMAVLVGTRIIRFAEAQLRLPISTKYLWTDSACVLSWIVRKPITTVFVQNRLREINSVPDLEFRHVPSSQNPADLPTRGLSLEDLNASALWWHGPPWLKNTADAWPTQTLPTPVIDSQLNQDLVEPCLPVPQENPQAALLVVSHFSSLMKLYRVTAYVFRFIRLARKLHRFFNAVVTSAEIETAEQYWEHRVQQDNFPLMLESNPDKKFKNLQIELGLFKDSNDFIRCRGRYLASSADDSNCPKLLPKNNAFTDLVIKNCHERLLHAGVKHTLAETRQHYWIVHGRNQVRRVLKKCMVCRYYDGGPFQTPRPPSLPEFRVTRQRPFETVGIDYLGPLFVQTKEDESSKVWICLFTCATVRAVHLEAVQDLSTQQFLLCFRRFIATFIRPKLIISDNAKHFHTAEKVLSRLWQEILHSDAVQSHSATEGISWKFITELAPWMGGFYERMVGTVKGALKKTVHRKHLTFVELHTLLCEICSVINSRPLLYEEETIEGASLTPAHFLMRKCQQLPSLSDELEYVPRPVLGNDLILQWKRSQALLDSFWKSWQTSYLQSLQDFLWKPKNRNTNRSLPTVGTVVLIKDKTPRGIWKLGRITQLIPSHDRVCRSAIVRLSSGTLLRRPISLLCPLELSENTAAGEHTTSIEPESQRLVPKRAAAKAAQCKWRNANNPSDCESQ